MIRAAAFLFGVLGALYWPSFWPVGWPGVAGEWSAVVAAVLTAGVIAMRWPVCRVPAVFFVIGLLWCQWHIDIALHQRIARRMDTIVSGCVMSPVRAEADRVRFDLRLNSLDGASSSGRVRLSWYRPARIPATGECWSLPARLMPPRGLVNRHGFDYEKYAFAQRLAGSGYVLATGGARRLAHATWRSPLLRMRLALAHRLRFLIGENASRGVLVALTIGLRDGIGPHQWQIFAKTGTSHLLAISGLHIGLLAGFGYLLGRGFPPLPVRGGCRQDMSRVVAWSFAAAYATVAGFALPTRRALVMVSVFVLAGLWRRPVASFDVLAVSLIVVLLLDPFAVLGAGLWLSFVAVSALLIVASAGPTRPFLPQLALFFALMPILSVWLGRFSLIAPLANFVVVPLFSFAIIPLAILAALLSVVDESLGRVFFTLAARMLDAVSAWLAVLASLELASLRVPARPLWTALLALCGAALFAVPSVTLRIVAATCCLPLLFGQVSRPAPGAFRLTVLDVGQGLAVLIETRRHVVVYDTGDAWRRSDAGRAVLVPELAALGAERLLALVISHADRDHRGGMASLLDQVPAVWRFSGEPMDEFGIASEPCRPGLGWLVDGVRFKFLHPDDNDVWRGNNASCVLRIEGPAGRVLLTGDIEMLAEIALYHGGRDLNAAVVVGQHHGSRTSSSAGFVAASRPDYVVFSTAAGNRWGLPDPAVVARWRHSGVVVVDTSSAGAVSFMFDPENALAAPTRARRERSAIWRLE